MKRRQRAYGSRDGVPKWAVAEADTVTHAVEGNIAAGSSRAVSPNGLKERDDSAGISDRGTYARVFQEPGKPRRFRCESSGTASNGNGANGTSDEVTEHPVVPAKQGNQLDRDPVEGRGCRSTEPLEGKMKETQSSASISTKQERIAELAKRKPETALNTLAHHIDLEWLREAYERTRKSGATGVDGQTAAEYAAKLEENLQSLLDRTKSGTYRAPPVRRVQVPKADGKQMRPIGIPTFEDKVLQRAVVMVLEAVYEQDFLDCSYGFRPGRSAHDALRALWRQTMRMGGGWILEVDVRKYFDTLDHAQLREILRQRVQDGVLLRLIGKWLNAGVMEDGALSYPNAGTPQGGVISPLLANVYLHEVLDEWFERTVKPALKGEGFQFRYADDFVIVFSCEQDARRVLQVLPKRFAKYGLTLHPEKTRLVEFRKPPRRAPPGGDDASGLGTFDFLGFTHFWARSRKSNWVLMRRTAKDRLRRALRSANQWCRQNRHRPIAEQQQILSAKLRGHFGYFGISGNSKAISTFAFRVTRIWRKWLDRRSQKARMTWARMTGLLQRYPLPLARIAHADT